MSETAFGPQDDYLESVSQRLANLECTDQFGKPVGGLSAAEKAAVLECALQLAAAGDAPIRCSLKLGAGVRKYVVLYAALLPLIKADAARTGRGILLLAAEGNREARAQNEFRGMFAVTIGTNIQFGTWDDIQPKAENGFKTTALSPYWVIGDLDMSAPDPAASSANMDHEYLRRLAAAKSAAVQRVLADGACPCLLIHQEGDKPLIAFPPSFSSKPAGKGGCFIATAACGSPYAEEVELLRSFRDEVLAPRTMGRAAVAVYEFCSPPLARWIATQPAIRKMVRGLFIRPLALLLGGKPRRPWTAHTAP